jgi:pectate lyase
LTRAVHVLLVLLGFGALGCGRELAQTAYREPDPSAPVLSCTTPVSMLPPAPDWAGGEIASSALTSSDYAAGEGPGLWLSARDAYRVYLNGVLIAESPSARASRFIPLTLLPGDNALAIAIWAEHDTPAALVQLDELSQSYVSDASWRVETTPAAGFSSPDFVDSAWSTATDYGPLGSLPGCDPSEERPLSASPRWIGPAAGRGSSAVVRRTIRIAPEGFGEAATGGGAAEPVVASTWQELEKFATDSETPTTILLAEGLHDFRRQGDEISERDVCPSICSEDPSKTLYETLTPNETCPVAQVSKPRDERTLKLISNKTIVGLGRGAQVRGVSFAFGSQRNIVLRNVAIYDVNHALAEAGDALGFDGAGDIWIDHVTTKWISDGLTDITAGTHGVTLSWMHYDGTTPDACRGRHTHASTMTAASVTLHHSFFDHTDSHAPLVDRADARVHIFNNLIQDDDGYGVGAACSAQVLLEGTTFKTVTTPTARRSCSDDTTLGRISAPAGSNLYLSDVGKHTGGDGSEPHDALMFTPTYEYALEPASEAWPKVLARAGAGGPWALPLSLDP